MIFSQFFGEPIACDAGEVRDISFMLMLMPMLKLTLTLMLMLMLMLML